MSDKEEHPFHDFVRTAMQQQPAYEEAHWEAMQKKIRIGRRHRYGLAGILALLLVGSVVWWMIAENSIFSKAQTPVLQSISNSTVPSASNSAEVASLPVVPEKKADKQSSETGKIVSFEKAKPPYKTTEQPETAFVLAAVLEQLSPRNPTFRLSSSVAVLDMNAPFERDIKQRLENHVIGPDSVTSRVLERNKNRWRNTVIVCDFTSSMYPHATELFAWLEQNRRNRYIKGAVFFTDCDSLGRETKVGVNPGKMYVIKDWQNADVLPVFIEASRNTVGNVETAENDLEAIVRAQEQFAGTESLVLIADNSSPVKDMHLLPKIKKPVRIILCGNTYNSKVAIQPDYLKIAAATKGSIHTLTHDLPDITKIKRGTRMQVGRYAYRYRRGQFVLRQ